MDMNKRLLQRLQNSEFLILEEVDRICKKNNINYVLVGGTLLGSIRHEGFIPWDDDLDIGMPRKDFEKFITVCHNDLDNAFLLDWYDTNKYYWLPFAKVRLKGTIYQEHHMENYNGSKGIWLDIFPLDNAKKEDSILQRFQFSATFFLKSVLAMKSKAIKVNSRWKRVVLSILSLLPKKILLWLQLTIMTLNKNDNSKYFVNLGSQYGYKKQTHLKNAYFPVKMAKFNGKKFPVPNNYDYVLTKIYGKNYMQLPPKEKRITHNPVRIKLLDGEDIKYEKV